MSRIPEIAAEDLTPEQREIRDAIVSTRSGNLRGPFALWIRNPKLARAANELGNALRLDGKLEPQLFEIVVLVVARHWSAQYEWFAHARNAARAGLNPEIIEAIRTNRVPPLETESQAIVYGVASELIATHFLTDSTYERALTTFGLELTMEIVATAGFYAMVAMTLNAFKAPVPGGARPLE